MQQKTRPLLPVFQTASMPFRQAWDTSTRMLSDAADSAGTIRGEFVQAVDAVSTAQSELLDSAQRITEVYEVIRNLADNIASGAEKTQQDAT